MNTLYSINYSISFLRQKAKAPLLMFSEVSFITFSTLHTTMYVYFNLLYLKKMSFSFSNFKVVFELTDKVSRFNLVQPKMSSFLMVINSNKR